MGDDLGGYKIKKWSSGGGDRGMMSNSSLGSTSLRNDSRTAHVPRYNPEPLNRNDRELHGASFLRESKRELERQLPYSEAKVPRMPESTIRSGDNAIKSSVNIRDNIDTRSKVTINNPLGTNAKKIKSPTPPNYAKVTKTNIKLGSPTKGRPPITAPNGSAHQQNPGKKIGPHLSKMAIGILISVLFISLTVGVIYIVMTSANTTLGTITLTATPSGGLGPYTYIWSVGNGCGSPIAGQTGNTLIINNAGSVAYSVKITDSEQPTPAAGCVNYSV